MNNMHNIIIMHNNMHNDNYAYIMIIIMPIIGILIIMPILGILL